MALVGYRQHLAEQLDNYADAINPTHAASIRRHFEYGELVLAANDLVSALAAERTPVSAHDAAVLRQLLEGVNLPPDTPADIADRLVVADQG